MRVVVVGATGNVGTAVVEALSRDPDVDGIVGVSRRTPVTGDGAAGVTYVAADIADDDLAPAFAGADAVIHLGWLFQPTHSPMTTWRVNAQGSVRVFEAAVAAGVGTLVYASSVGAYSPVAADRRDEPVDESWPTHSTPTAAYGREKAYVERVLDAVEARYPEMRVVRFRPAFIFQRRSATQQRRLFAGPFAPDFVGRRGAVPVVPLPRSLRFQALHTADAAEAYRLALHRDVRGAFNIAAHDVIDARRLAEVLGGRLAPVPRRVVRGALATAWHLHVVPAEPALFDLAMDLPLLSTARARSELGWAPTTTAAAALREMLDGLAAGAGGSTPPLAPDSVGARLRELRTAVGERAS